jgi:hypothetical protein
MPPVIAALATAFLPFLSLAEFTLPTTLSGDKPFSRSGQTAPAYAVPRAPENNCPFAATAVSMALKI